MAGKKHTDLPIPGERSPPRYEVRIGKRVEDSGGDFNSLDEAKACLARKRRLDRDCHIWDRREQKRVAMGTREAWRTRSATARQMNSEITSSVMQKLIGVNKVTLNDLAKRGIVMRGSARALTSWRLRSTGTASTSALWRPGAATNQARRLGRASGLLLISALWPGSSIRRGDCPKSKRSSSRRSRAFILSWALSGLLTVL